MMLDPSIILNGTAQTQQNINQGFQNFSDLTSRFALKRKMQQSDNAQMNNLVQDKDFRRFLRNAPINQMGANNAFQSLQKVVGTNPPPQNMNRTPLGGSLMSLIFGSK